MKDRRSKQRIKEEREGEEHRRVRDPCDVRQTQFSLRPVQLPVANKVSLAREELSLTHAYTQIRSYARTYVEKNSFSTAGDRVFHHSCSSLCSSICRYYSSLLLPTFFASAYFLSSSLLLFLLYILFFFLPLYPLNEGSLDVTRTKNSHKVVVSRYMRTFFARSRLNIIIRTLKMYEQVRVTQKRIVPKKKLNNSRYFRMVSVGLLKSEEQLTRLKVLEPHFAKVLF